MSSESLLVVVPCGRSKVWDRHPELGPVFAKDAYTGAPFKVNRHYAERIGDAWIILSAKYGFVPPEALIAGPYEVTFKQSSTRPVTADVLRRQVDDLHLSRFDVIVGLGGKDYRAAMEAAFAGSSVRLAFPFAGLPLGRAMQATKATTAMGRGSLVGAECRECSFDQSPSGSITPR
jgi:hypothetical protein